MDTSVLSVLEELARIGDNPINFLARHDQITNSDVLYLLGSVKDFITQNEASEFFVDAIDALVDVSWEECNIGHWSEVPESPKIIYAYSSFLKVLARLKEAVSSENRNQLLNEAVAAADLGLMLGKGYDIQLTRAASLITALLGSDEPSEPLCNPEPGKSKGSCGNLSDEYFIEKLDVTHLSRSSCPSLEEFSVKYFYSHTPVLLTDCIDHWPALKRWGDMDYLIRLAGPRTVPVEIGSSYTQKDWGMELISLQDFISKHIRGKASKVGYLAQHQLFDQIPELKKDIVVPDYCCLSENEDGECDVNINSWFGPANTLTPLHHDPKHNLLCQVVGSKRVILYSPEDSKFLHPHDESMLNNTAKVDPYNPDYEKFPDFKNATAYYCRLKPAKSDFNFIGLEEVENFLKGEMLYIPPKWWHHVVSLDVSFSVSFWWE